MPRKKKKKDSEFKLRPPEERLTFKDIEKLAAAALADGPKWTTKNTLLQDLALGSRFTLAADSSYRGKVLHQGVGSVTIRLYGESTTTTVAVAPGTEVVLDVNRSRRPQMLTSLSDLTKGTTDGPKGKKVQPKKRKKSKGKQPKTNQAKPRSKPKPKKASGKRSSDRNRRRPKPSAKVPTKSTKKRGTAKKK